MLGQRQLVGVVACLLPLLCQLMATANGNKTLVFDTDSREELTRDQMYEQLNRVDSKQVASVLSHVKDKDSTRVTNGLTVEKLLKQNELSESQCNRLALRKRVAICERTKNFTNLNVYCRQCLLEAAKFCLEQMDVAGEQVNSPHETDGRWLKGLAEVVKLERQNQQFGTERNQLERYLTVDADQ